MPQPTIEEMRRALVGKQKPTVDAMRAALAGTAPPDAEAPITEEQHPDVGFGERFAIKNFGLDEPSAVAYLNKKHPDLDVQTRDGRIVIKRKDEKEWRVLDPAGFDLQDLSDVAYDLGAGAAESAAAVTAGLGAGAATGGIGAIPAAMAAGGTAGAGLEALRQKIGAGLGVSPEELQMAQVALSGAAGAASPLLFGTGATAAQIAGKAGSEAGKKVLSRAGQSALGETLTGAEQKLATELLGQTQKSPTGWLMGKASELFAGVPSEYLDTALKPAPEGVKKALKLADNASNLDAAERINQVGVSDALSGEMKATRQKLGAVADELEAQYDQALNSVGVTFNLPEYGKPFQEFINKQKAAAELTTGMKEEVNDIQGVLDKFFFYETKAKTIAPDGSITEKIVKQPVTQAQPQQAMALKQQLKFLADKFGNTEDKDPATRTIARLAGDAYNQLDADLGEAISFADNQLGGQGKLAQTYRDFSEIRREIMPLLDSPKKAFNSLRTIDNPSKKTLAETIQRMDTRYGTNLGDLSGTLQTWSMFGKPSFDAISSRGTTSTSRSVGGIEGGRAAGQIFGKLLGGSQGGVAGRAAGGALASKAMSPAAIKAYLQGKQALGRGAGKLGIGDMLRALELKTPEELKRALKSAPYSGSNIILGEDVE